MIHCYTTLEKYRLQNDNLNFFQNLFKQMQECSVVPTFCVHPETSCISCTPGILQIMNFYLLAQWNIIPTSVDQFLQPLLCQFINEGKKKHNMNLAQMDLILSLNFSNCE